ncbi:hypothetical protein DC030_15470 [Enterococcus faecalis]|nr:hypothetical protein DC030_15470 [Enterococcus faecalis]
MPIIAAGGAAVADDGQVGVSFVGMMGDDVEIGVVVLAAIAKLPLAWFDVVPAAVLVGDAPAVSFGSVGRPLQFPKFSRLRDPLCAAPGG